MHDFDVVLVLEELDLSLAVLALTFCWEAEDVVHFKLNTMVTKTERRPLSDMAKERLKSFNWPDEALYNSAKKKLHDQVWRLGRSRVNEMKSSFLPCKTWVLKNFVKLKEKRIIEQLSEQLKQECTVSQNTKSNAREIRIENPALVTLKNATCFSIRDQFI